MGFIGRIFGWDKQKLVPNLENQERRVKECETLVAEAREACSAALIEFHKAQADAKVRRTQGSFLSIEDRRFAERKYKDYVTAKNVAAAADAELQQARKVLNMIKGTEL